MIIFADLRWDDEKGEQAGQATRVSKWRRR